MSANLGRVQAFDDSMPVKAERLDIMRTFWAVRNKSKGYILFTTDLQLAEIARRVYPQLKHSRIMNVLQAYPERVKLGQLYQHGQEVQL